MILLCADGLQSKEVAERFGVHEHTVGKWRRRWSDEQRSGFPGSEIGMLVVETVARIRREHAGGKSIKTIARDLCLSRKVVRRAIRAPEGAFDYHGSVQLDAD